MDWWTGRELNPRPFDCESNITTTELPAPNLPPMVPISRDIIIYNNFSREALYRLVYLASDRKQTGLLIQDDGESVANVPASVQGISYFIYFE